MAAPATGSQRVLVNGRPVDLPVRWAEGTLAARRGTPTAVRLDWPRPDADTALAAELQRTGRVVLPGLYFDFGQATLQSASEAALSACVRALKPLAGRWRVEGHTDAIGSEPANRALSLARAQAVLQALVSREPSLAGRLQAAGLGASQPAGDNTTADGRARNRRVELVRV